MNEQYKGINAEELTESYLTAITPFAKHLPPDEQEKIYHIGIALLFKAIYNNFEIGEKRSAVCTGLKELVQSAADYHIKKAGLSALEAKVERGKVPKYADMQSQPVDDDCDYEIGGSD